MTTWGKGRAATRHGLDFTNSTEPQPGYLAQAMREAVRHLGLLALLVLLAFGLLPPPERAHATDQETAAVLQGTPELSSAPLEPLPAK